MLNKDVDERDSKVNPASPITSETNIAFEVISVRQPPSYDNRVICLDEIDVVSERGRHGSMLAPFCSIAGGTNCPG